METALLGFSLWQSWSFCLVGGVWLALMVGIHRLPMLFSWVCLVPCSGSFRPLVCFGGLSFSDGHWRVEVFSFSRIAVEEGF